MRRIVICMCLIYGFVGATAQIYVLKDHRDSIKPNVLFDSLPILCDSVFNSLKYEDIKTIKSFVPELRFLKETLDSGDVEYNEANALYRQQKIQRNLEFQYKKILKEANKNDIKLNKLEYADTEYKYGYDDKGHEFCFVTIVCNRRKKQYGFKFLAIKLNGKWFVGDQLEFIKI